MTSLDVANYAGREQAYVKHTFLNSYLDGLLYKVAHFYDEIAYVDGFAGPWQSAAENYSDTSFGIALQKLTDVKAQMAKAGKAIKAKAVLVEADGRAYAELRDIGARFPEVDVKTIHGDFLQHAEAIRNELGNSAFAFIFVDPKGWAIDMAELGKLVSRPNCEVVFNFMFDFVNRSISFDSVEPALNRLFVGVPDWKQRILSDVDRKAATFQCFREALSSVGNYRYCLETEVLRANADRVLYALVYGTRNFKGVEVFRDTQVKALLEQSAMRADLQAQRIERSSGEVPMFSFHELGRIEMERFLRAQSQSAEQAMLEAIPLAPSTISFAELSLLAMSGFIVRRISLGQALARMRAEGLVTIEPWPDRKRVPEIHYKVSRAI